MLHIKTLYIKYFNIQHGWIQNKKILVESVLDRDVHSLLCVLKQTYCKCVLVALPCTREHPHDSWIGFFALLNLVHSPGQADRVGLRVVNSVMNPPALSLPFLPLHISAPSIPTERTVLIPK